MVYRQATKAIHSICVIPADKTMVVCQDLNWLLAKPRCVCVCVGEFAYFFSLPATSLTLISQLRASCCGNLQRDPWDFETSMCPFQWAG